MPKRLPEPLCIGCRQICPFRIKYLSSRREPPFFFRGVGDGKRASIKKFTSFHPIFYSLVNNYLVPYWATTRECSYSPTFTDSSYRQRPSVPHHF